MEYFGHLGMILGNIDYQDFQCKLFGEVIHYNTIGLSLAVENNILKYIVFDPKYHGKLPFGLNWKENNSNIVARFGEPDKKTASKALGIEITYIAMGTSLEFLNHDWEDRNNPLKSVILFKGSVADPFNYSIACNLCSLCYGETNLKCSACKLIFYCNRECQISHWNKHKPQCIIYGKLTRK